MKKRVRVILILLCVAVMAYASVRIVMIQREYKKGEELYDAARKQFLTEPEPTSEPAEPSVPAESSEEPKYVFPSLKVDFESLIAVNSDIIGWIWMPGTVISYPLLRCDDNEQYLETGYDGEYRLNGSIYVDQDCDPTLSSRYTLIYGHNLRNGIMFSDLLRFRDSGYALEHGEFFIFTPERNYRYEVFASYDAEVDSDVYSLSFKNDDKFLEFLSARLGDSTTDYGISPIASDRVVTLSTCNATGNRSERYVVLGVLANTEDIG